MSVGADQMSVRLDRNFHGCLENLVFNGLNLVELAKQRDRRVSVKVNWQVADIKQYDRNVTVQTVYFCK